VAWLGVCFISPCILGAGFISDSLIAGDSDSDTATHHILVSGFVQAALISPRNVNRKKDCVRSKVRRVCRWSACVLTSALALQLCNSVKD
jgi:hypothetical protein